MLWICIPVNASRNIWRVLLSLCCLAACQRVPDQVEPHLNYAVQDKYLEHLPRSPFPPLTPQERAEDWGKEYLVGMGFAHELNLYQAIVAFKRGTFLVTDKERKCEMQYEILLCYYLGKKYADVIDTFEHSDLKRINPNFPTLHDLLVMLYESYLVEKQETNAAHTFELIRHYYPETAEKLTISTVLSEGHVTLIPALAEQYPDAPYLNTFLAEYAAQKKSPATAQFLNSTLPGAGYLYLGQNQSALTAFLLNGLFIAGSAYAFERGNIPVGIILASFEAGWYFGGIYGAGLEAKFYNERLYEKLATPMMNQNGLFPVLMLQYTF
jgi:hypothetical protein